MEVFYHLFIGFLCGLTLSLNTFTYGCMIVSKKFSVVEVGYSYLSLLPYSCAFLWSYFFDLYKIRIFNLDYVKSWLIIISFFLILSIIFMSYYVDMLSFWYLVLCNFFICIFTVSKDVLLGYWRINFDNNSVNNSRYYAIGYKLGMMFIIFFGLQLINYDFKWSDLYFIYACIIVILLIIFLFFSINIKEKEVVYSKTWEIVLDFNRYKYIFLALFLYNACDRLIMTVLKKFLIDYGFSIGDIGYYKMFASFGSLLGYIVVGYVKVTLRGLVYSGVLHSSVHILLYFHSVIGKSYILHIFITALESFTGGICIVFYMGYIAYLTKSIYVYSILSSVMGVSNVILPIISGYLVNYYSWSQFFLLIFILSYLFNYLTYIILKYIARVKL